MEAVFRHYLREDVGFEVARFCRRRWVAVECLSKGGRRAFYRYWGSGVPLRIHEPADLKKILNRFGPAVPRTIYGSACVYRDLSSGVGLGREDNVLGVTPSWDIDGSLDEEGLIIEAAGIIVDELRRNGVDESIYLVWSGRGIHVHINERAISDGIWAGGPLRVAHAIVEYVLRNVKDQILRLCERSRSRERGLKVENLMDVQRVFTAPLSLHRELDLVAVTISPDDLGNFDLSWADLNNFRYWRDWGRYREGEADKLALKAVEEVGDGARTRLAAGEGGPIGGVGAAGGPRVGHIGRFQVMALLQAARYYLLRGDLELAKSFGLNRAIFYAWAKKRGVAARRLGGGAAAPTERTEGVEERVGDEAAFKSPRGWFTIGGQVQRPADFDRQVAARFGGEFEMYWSAALEYLKSFPRETLEAQREFYEKVYLPVRDNPSTILGFLGRRGGSGT